MNGVSDRAAMKAAACRHEHDEVLAALQAIGNPTRGEAIRLDRGSALPHLGIGFPALRARVKQGFSFSTRPAAEAVAVWDSIWHQATHGDVLFAALEALLTLAAQRSSPPPSLMWPAVRTWAARIDNWCHADKLGALVSILLERDVDRVYPQLQAWNRADGEWLKRLSITSLIHYSGKNAVFLPAEPMLPLLQGCLGDRRDGVDAALGWVLREMARVYPGEAAAFVAQHAAQIGPRARARLREGGITVPRPAEP